jgi:3-dehydroquinate synthase II
VTIERVLIAPSSPDPAARLAILERARAAGFRGFVVDAPVPPTDPRSGEEWYRRTRAGYRALAGGAGTGSVRIVTVASPAELETALAVASGSGGVALRWKGERVIPLETVVARGHRRFRVWVATDRIEEVHGALGALERGADRVVVELGATADVDALAARLDVSDDRPLRWGRATVTRCEPAGVSERVIVDTSSLLLAKEGLLLGSSAGLLFHVASEAVGSRYTRPRPFRVNAGSPHSYVLMADGTTRYLSELEAGDSLLVTTPRGVSRAVRVGRLKIERRPMVLVAARSSSQVATIFLQEAETVRLSTDRGPVPSTAVRAGMRLLSVSLPRGRHLGVEVEETVEER